MQMFEVGKYTVGDNKYWESECSQDVGLLFIPVVLGCDKIIPWMFLC